MFELIALSFVIMLASLTGVLVVWGKAGSFVERNLDYLVSFSAGVFLVFLFGLASEAVELASSPTAGLLWILGGAVGIWVLFKFFPNPHAHSHAHPHTHPNEHTPLDPRRIIATDALHNVADGIFLAAAYAVSPMFALVAAVSVFIHEALQEVSEFFVLRDGGYTTRQALTINFLVSSTILVGAVGGYLLLDWFAILEGPLLGLAAGGLLIVVLLDLIPHSLRSGEGKAHVARHIAWFVLGALIMTGVSVSTGHTHAEEGGHHHEDELHDHDH